MDFISFEPRSPTSRHGKLRSPTDNEDLPKFNFFHFCGPYRNFLLGKSPCSTLGPSAHIGQVGQQTITVADPRTQRVTWDAPPNNVLIIRKPQDEHVCGKFFEAVRSLIEDRNMTVFVEESALKVTPATNGSSNCESSQAKRAELGAYVRAGRLHTFHEALNCLSNQIDFVVCLGGDGTLLHVSNLFQTSVPPVLPFNFGTLGFLTPLPVSEFQSRIDALLRGDSNIVLRSRLRCELYTQKLPASSPSSSVASLNVLAPNGHLSSHVDAFASLSLGATTSGGSSSAADFSKSNTTTAHDVPANRTEDSSGSQHRELNTAAAPVRRNSLNCLAAPMRRVSNGRVATTSVEKPGDIRSGMESPSNLISPSLDLAFSMLILNDVVISRCPPQILCQLDVFVEDELVTSVVSDGLIIATTTGSTAYAMSAGASLCHPNVPAILIVPICAHSLSFRPLVLPIGLTVRIAISPNARYNYASIAFDGREMRQLRSTDVLMINTSRYPVPCVCADDPLKDWFAGLRACLHWNTRKA